MYIYSTYYIYYIYAYIDRDINFQLRKKCRSL